MSFLYEQSEAQRWIAPWLRHQNLSRYEWAASYARAKQVIEVGCGNGRGAALLAKAGAESVLGVDVSTSAIAVAHEKHSGAGIAFAVSDGRSVPAPSGNFDLALALEAIEHVRDDRGFVREIARVLRPTGVFLCSTPNRVLTNPGTGLSDAPFNRHHVREYARAELAAVLGSGFGRVEILGQTFYRDAYRCSLAAVGHLLPGLAARLHQARKVAGMPFETPRRHQPGPIPRRRTPEVLLAVCRLPRQ